MSYSDEEVGVGFGNNGEIEGQGDGIIYDNDLPDYDVEEVIHEEILPAAANFGPAANLAFDGAV